jgi:hypothetical protein
MEEIASGQTVDMRASIAEATRAAQAMENIAVALGSSVSHIQESLEIAREANLLTREAQRAWVGIAASPPIQLDINDAGLMRVSIPIQNSGSTPAFDVEVNAAVISQKASDPIPIARLDAGSPAYISRALLLPNSTFLAIMSDQWKDGAVLRAQISAGIAVVYILGRIQYRDTAGMLRHTQFCHLTDPAGTIVIGPSFNGAD